MLSFDEKAFLADFFGYVDRHGYTHAETALLCCIERQTIIRLRKREPSLRNTGLSIDTVLRLAAFADLDINKYAKELTWTQQQQKKRNALRHSKQESVVEDRDPESSANSAPPVLEAIS